MSLPLIPLRDFAPWWTLRPLTLKFRTLLYQSALDALRSTDDANKTKWSSWVNQAKLNEEIENTEHVLAQHFFERALQHTVTRFSDEATEHVQNILEASTDPEWQKHMLDELAKACAERARNYFRLSEEGKFEVPEMLRCLTFPTRDMLDDLASKENSKYLYGSVAW